MKMKTALMTQTVKTQMTTDYEDSNTNKIPITWMRQITPVIMMNYKDAFNSII